MSEEAAESHDQNSDQGQGQHGITKLLEDHFSKLSGSVKTLAQAVQTLRSDVNELKRKGQSTIENNESSAAKQKKTTDGQADESPSTSATNAAIGASSKRADHNLSDESECDEDDIDAIMDEPDEQDEDDSIDLLADLENFFDHKDETGPEVGERIAKCTDKALRGKMTEEDDKNLDELKKKNKRPANVPNMQIPMIEEFLWRQLKRETKTYDFVQKKSLENYNLVLSPLIKALDLFKSKSDHNKAVEHVKDAYKIIGLTIKSTNIARMDKIKKELHPDYKSLCKAEDMTTTLLLGENVTDKIKKVKEGSRSTLTGSHFLAKRGGNRYFNKNKGASHKYHNNNSNYNNNNNRNPNYNYNYKKHQGNKKKSTQYQNKK